MKSQAIAAVPRIALTRPEAALSLGVSLSHFERHVQPHLRMIRCGSARLIPVAELISWTDKTATLAGGDSLAVTEKAPGRRLEPAPRHGPQE